MAAQSASTIPARVKDITGGNFGRWRAVEYVRPAEKAGYFWLCRCECGAEKLVNNRSLTRGESRSCGCLRAESTGARFAFGGKKPKSSIKDFPREYASYNAMITRCFNAGRDRYEAWGGRGIRVCDRWRHGEGGMSGFDCFLADMGRRPVGRSIDRYPDNDGNYEPGNCRWATPRQQNLNQRRRAR